MSEANAQPVSTAQPVEAEPPRQHIDVAPAPHLLNAATSTRRMMTDVLIALSPAFAVALYVFHWHAVRQVGICVLGCIAAETLFAWARGRKTPVGDFSAAVTGVILAFSLPATAPWWVSVIACFAGIGIGKAVFGGLGQNLFNPAMVGRAFVMIAFAGFLAAGGYVDPKSTVHAITEATPMTAAYKAGRSFDLWRLILGNANGSLGETSALALVIGGLYLCLRRAASWELPAGAVLGLLAIAGLDNLLHPDAGWTALHHLLGGAFLLGAFFIITDPVSSPLTPKGKLIFGAAFGVLVMLIRLFTPYPEGVMFSVLLVNAIAPLINRWTIPTPLGGTVPAGK